MPATKRFTVHRTSNVLTLSLKRFANFSGGKITKVSKESSSQMVVSFSVYHNFSIRLSLLLFFPGCWISRIPEHPPLHVSELRRPCYVRPLCCSGALWVQLSRWPLLLLCQGEATRCTTFNELFMNFSVIVVHWLIEKPHLVVALIFDNIMV